MTTENNSQPLIPQNQPAPQPESNQEGRLLPCPWCDCVMEKRGDFTHPPEGGLWTSHPRTDRCFLDGMWFNPEKWNKRAPSVPDGTAANKTDLGKPEPHKAEEVETQKALHEIPQNDGPPPKGYRLLSRGEIIAKGDVYQVGGVLWRKAGRWGKKYNPDTDWLTARQESAADSVGRSNAANLPPGKPICPACGKGEESDHCHCIPFHPVDLDESVSPAPPTEDVTGELLCIGGDYEVRLYAHDDRNIFKYLVHLQGGKHHAPPFVDAVNLEVKRLVDSSVSRLQEQIKKLEAALREIEEMGWGIGNAASHAAAAGMQEIAKEALSAAEARVKELESQD